MAGKENEAIEEPGLEEARAELEHEMDVALGGFYDNDRVRAYISLCTEVAKASGLTLLDAYQAYRSLYAACAVVLGKKVCEQYVEE